MYPVKMTSNGHGLGQVKITAMVVVPEDSGLFAHAGEDFSVDSHWEGEPPNRIATATPGRGPFGPIAPGKTIYYKDKYVGERHTGAEAEDNRGARFAGGS